MVKAVEANTSGVVTVIYDAEESDGVRSSFLHRQGVLTPYQSPEQEEVSARDRGLDERACEKPSHVGVDYLAPSSSPCTISWADVCGTAMEPRQTLSQMRSGGGRA
jgi:hypothetical protein